MFDHVEVTGTGSASAVPDVVVLDARVSCDAPDVAGALAKASERVSAALAAASEAGVAAADRQSTGMGVNSRWDHEGRGVIGYSAYQSLRLLVRDGVGDLISALARAAGDSFGLDGVRLEVAEKAPLVEQARAAAFADAVRTATQYAQLAGRPLGQAVKVIEAGSGPGPAPKMRAMAAMDSVGGMPIEAGEHTVTVTVAVRFGLG
ncbi:MAG TPA: SIMPL domain-containing protein [Ornithinibacter sp.]|nr:SIMPL domain-containing protein [Ornithinibacter sp.]